MGVGTCARLPSLRFSLSIESATEALTGDDPVVVAAEVARILSKLADRVRFGASDEMTDEGAVYVDGNVVGFWSFTITDAEQEV